MSFHFRDCLTFTPGQLNAAVSRGDAFASQSSAFHLIFCSIHYSMFFPVCKRFRRNSASIGRLLQGIEWTSQSESVQQALFFRVLKGRIKEISETEGEQRDADKAQGAGEGNIFFDLNVSVGKIDQAGR